MGEEMKPPVNAALRVYVTTWGKAPGKGEAIPRKPLWEVCGTGRFKIRLRSLNCGTDSWNCLFQMRACCENCEVSWSLVNEKWNAEMHENVQFLCRPITLYVSRVSSGSVVSEYGLDDRAIGVRSPAGAKDFSSVLSVQTGSGAHPASCTMGTGGPFPWGKARQGRDADHSPPSSAVVVNE
jgi:hypothetical protein